MLKSQTQKEALGQWTPAVTKQSRNKLELGAPRGCRWSREELRVRSCHQEGGDGWKGAPRGQETRSPWDTPLWTVPRRGDR